MVQARRALPRSFAAAFRPATMIGSSHANDAHLATAHACMVAYLLDPLHGSEPTNAWNWVGEMSRRVGRVTVVTSPRTVNRLGGLGEAGHRLSPNVDIVAVPTPRKAMAPPIPDWYREYAGWLDAAADAVADVGADISHHVMVGTPFWGSSLSRGMGPKILGPVGISPAPPLWTAPRWGARDAASEAVRGALGALPAVWRRGLAGVRGADHVLATDPRTVRMAQSQGTRWSKELLEGVATAQGGDPAVARTAVLVWAGKFIPRKAPELAIRAWAAAASSLPAEARLVMYGDGPLRQDMQMLTERLGLERGVVLPGRVPQPTVEAALRSSRGLLFTSLRDTSSTQILEACASGTPSVSLRHPGVMGLDLWYPREAGWSAEAGSWGRAIGGLSQAIAACMNAPEGAWTARSERCLSLAEGHTWAAKADRMVGVYRSLLER